MALPRQLYAVVPHRATHVDTRPRKAVAPIEERKAEKLAELKAKTAVDRLNKLLDRIERDQAALAERIAQLQRRKKLLCARCERLTDAVIGVLEDAGLRRADGFQTALTLTPSPSSVEIIDQALVPNEYLRQPKTPPAAPDKIAIRVALEQGTPVPGARLLQGMTLRRS